MEVPPYSVVGENERKYKKIRKLEVSKKRRTIFNGQRYSVRYFEILKDNLYKDAK